MIPLGVTVRLRRTGRRGFAVWIPLFLLWLLLLPVALVLFPVVYLACLFVRVNAVQLYMTAWRILASLRHTLIEVEDAEHAVRIHIA